MKIEEFIHDNGLTIGLAMVSIMTVCFCISLLRIPEELKGGVLLRVNETLAIAAETKQEVNFLRAEVNKILNKMKISEFQPREVY